MPKRSYTKSDKQIISVRDKKIMMENQFYRMFSEERKEIQAKYDKRIFFNTGIRSTIKHNKWFREEGRWEYRKYLNEIYDVMMKVDSNYSKFMEDIEPEMDKIKRERFK